MKMFAWGVKMRLHFQGLVSFLYDLVTKRLQMRSQERCSLFWLVGVSSDELSKYIVHVQQIKTSAVIIGNAVSLIVWSIKQKKLIFLLLIITWRVTQNFTPKEYCVFKNNKNLNNIAHYIVNCKLYHINLNGLIRIDQSDSVRRRDYKLQFVYLRNLQKFVQIH